MNNRISLLLIVSIIFSCSCTKQDYFNIPTDGNGNAVITTVSTCTSPGITLLDSGFVVNATLPNAKAGDIMTVELLKSQVPAGGGSEQLLPLAGTQKQITVDKDLKATVNFTRQEAKMNVPGDVVTVTFAGKTESASVVVTMKKALTVSTPQYNGSAINVVRGAGTAEMKIMVQPVSYKYLGSVEVKKKNGTNDAWVNVGNFPSESAVPISGDDFAVGKDTMYYSFISKVNNFADTVKVSVINNNPYFFFKKSGVLELGGSKAGVNLLINANVTATDANAMLAIDNKSITLHGGSAWIAAGNSISFVPSTLAQYNQNDPVSTQAAFASGTPTTTADPVAGEGVYIFKLVNNGVEYYGMLKIANAVPGTSLGYEYRIGNLYSQLADLK
ncbi:hypothetical protein QTN47_06920 [Danxiaibacter flavus]|uniref:DUF1735 domain-containing protein n=1 Tax=Danxiaibacter flavus TaxID=3049108 RepID=A0ABV3ZBH5_9BACT|nr:hypothetical protein QNM32_06920 [Chitinophagaceae bacterium DXS]